jgi:hypothetical protein
LYNENEEKSWKKDQGKALSRLTGVQHEASLKKNPEVITAALLENEHTRHSAARPLAFSFVMFEADMAEREVHRCSLQRAALVERRIAQSANLSVEHRIPHVAAKTAVLKFTSSVRYDTSRERRGSFFLTIE